jgi:nicotinamidase/pyrazinamidase
MDALIVVDVQNDFCPGGALPVPDGDEVIGPLNALARDARFVVATRDWHPHDHQSFSANGGPWPEHCVQGRPGAELHPDIDRSLLDIVVDKGQAPDTEGYSGFQGTELEQLLRDRGVEEVHVGGLALDYCVRATALDARNAGFAVVLHEDATRPVDPSAAGHVVEELRAAGVRVEG